MTEPQTTQPSAEPPDPEDRLSAAQVAGVLLAVLVVLNAWDLMTENAGDLTLPPEAAVALATVFVVALHRLRLLVSVGAMSTVDAAGGDASKVEMPEPPAGEVERFTLAFTTIIADIPDDLEDEPVEEAEPEPDVPADDDVATAEAELADLDAQIAAEDAARDRALAEDEARQRPADREQRREERAQRNVERRRDARASQRARVERLARSEAWRAADDTAGRALIGQRVVLGWVRKLSVNACELCTSWWASGGGQFAMVRPLNIKMKRHPGCQCLRVVVTQQEEVSARGTSDRPELVSDAYRAHRAERRRNRERERDTTGG